MPGTLGFLKFWYFPGILLSVLTVGPLDVKMVTCDTETTRITAASVLPLTAVEAKHPPLASYVDQVYLARWTSHTKLLL